MIIADDKIERLRASHAVAPAHVELDPSVGPETGAARAAAFYDEAYSSLVVLLDETTNTRKAALVVLAAIGLVNDEADYEEFRATVTQLLEADKLALERWLAIYQAGAK